MSLRFAAAVLLLAACSSSPKGAGAGGEGGEPEDTGGSGGSTSTGGKPAGTGGKTGGSGGAATGGSVGATGGSGGASGGSGGSTVSPDAGVSPDGASAGAGGGGGASATGGAGGRSPLLEGFTELKITYNVQSPHTVPQADRYTFDAATNTHNMWVKSDDSSFQAGNGTDPRTELRHTNEYNSGKHMLEADVWIHPDTHRTSICQSFSTSPPTSFMLTAWKDRTLRYYFGTGNGPIIMMDAFDKWFNLKVLHDAAAGKVTVYINDVMSMSFADRGSSWHWKNGVYGCSSQRCETRWRNLKHWVKN
jgi:hypothetical protein